MGLGIMPAAALLPAVDGAVRASRGTIERGLLTNRADLSIAMDGIAPHSSPIGKYLHP